MALISIAVILTVVIVVSILRHFNNVNKNRLPKDVKQLPGPKGLPIIGSAHELPDKNSWLKFHEWGEQYGPLYQVNIAGVNHVWITRDKIAHDLLAKRSAIYSDRPFIPALEQDNRTSGQYLPLMSRNALWARQRRFARRIMDTSQKSSFYGYPELEAIRLLVELLTDPLRYNVAMESYIARITSRLAWGTSVPSEELKQRARELLMGVSPAGALGNKLPFLMSLPEKLSAAKAWESRRSRTERKFFEGMQQEVQREIDGSNKSADGSAPTIQMPKPSWMRMFLEKRSIWGFASDLEGAFAVGMHGIAGALTIAAPMQSFCLAMCHYPQYQVVLHAEIDRVLGDRMPTFSDMPEMPVLRAFIRETMRWRPPVPTGIPHELIKDDIYEGYHIPAGSVMHPLEWSISRDPEVFPDPDAWNPLRWLEPKYPTYLEPLSTYPTISQYSQFGYGRRMCQGMAVTEADLFVGLGSVAWLFSMHAVDTATGPGMHARSGWETAQSAATTEAEADAAWWLEAEAEAADDRASVEQNATAEAEAESWLQTEMEAANNRAFFEQDAEAGPQRWSQPRVRSGTRQHAFVPSDERALVEASREEAVVAQPDDEQARLAADAEREFFERNAKRIKRESWDPRRVSAELLSGLRSPPLHIEEVEPRLVNDALLQAPVKLAMHINNDSAVYLAEDVVEDAATSPPMPESHDLSRSQSSISNRLSVDSHSSMGSNFSVGSRSSVGTQFSGGSRSSVDSQSSLSQAGTELSAPSPTKLLPKQSAKDDPTMDFSTLLIAKPMPFKFSLCIRSKVRAETVARKWLDLKMEGEFEDSRVFWAGGKSHAGDAQFGWGATHL